MIIRELNTDERNIVVSAGYDDLEVMLGQDNDWYIYSNEIDAYSCLDLSRRWCYDEDTVRVAVKHLAPWNDPYREWIFGDDFEI